MLSALLQNNFMQVNSTAAKDFIAGYLFELTGQNQFDYLTECFQDDQQLANIMDEAMRDQQAGEFEKAMEQWKKIAPMYEEDIKGCTDVLDAYNAIKKYRDDVLARPDA